MKGRAILSMFMTFHGLWIISVISSKGESAALSWGLERHQYLRIMVDNVSVKFFSTMLKILVVINSCLEVICGMAFSMSLAQPTSMNTYKMLSTYIILATIFSFITSMIFSGTTIRHLLIFYTTFHIESRKRILVELVERLIIAGNSILIVVLLLACLSGLEHNKAKTLIRTTSHPHGEDTNTRKLIAYFVSPPKKTTVANSLTERYGSSFRNGFRSMAIRSHRNSKMRRSIRHTKS